MTISTVGSWGNNIQLTPQMASDFDGAPPQLIVDRLREDLSTTWADHSPGMVTQKEAEHAHNTLIALAKHSQRGYLQFQKEHPPGRTEVSINSSTSNAAVEARKFEDVAKKLIKDDPALLNNYLAKVSAKQTADFAQALMATGETDLIASLPRALDGPQWTKMVGALAQEGRALEDFTAAIGQKMTKGGNRAEWLQLGNQALAARTFAAGIEAKYQQDDLALKVTTKVLSQAAGKAGPAKPYMEQYVKAFESIEKLEQSQVKKIRTGEYWTTGGASAGMREAGTTLKGLDFQETLSQLQTIHDNL